MFHDTVKYLQTPPQSLDLSPIEYLGDHLERDVLVRHILTKKHLKKRLEEE